MKENCQMDSEPLASTEKQLNAENKLLTVEQPSEVKS